MFGGIYVRQKKTKKSLKKIIHIYVRRNSQTRLTETFLRDIKKREIKNASGSPLFIYPIYLFVLVVFLFQYLNCRSFVYYKCLLNICQQYLFGLF